MLRARLVVASLWHARRDVRRPVERRLLFNAPMRCLEPLLKPLHGGFAPAGLHGIGLQGWLSNKGAC